MSNTRGRCSEVLKMGCGSSNTRTDSKETRVVFIGLDGSGKTTLLYRLKLEAVVPTYPTVGFNVEQVRGPRPRKQLITIWDIGGQDGVRKLWRQFYDNRLSALVYVVDSANTERLEQAREILFEQLLENEDLRGTPLLVLANKADLPGALGIDVITEKLHLKKLKRNYWEVLSVSGKSGQAVDDITSTILHIKSKKGKPVKDSVSRQKKAYMEPD